MSRAIPPLDLLWLLIETANTLTHVGAVIMRERPANAAPDFIAEIVKS